MPTTGLWLVGARGSVATTAVTGLLALRAGLIAPTGCVTESEPFAGVGLPAWDQLVVGGHDVVHTPLDKRAEQLAESGLIPHRVLAAVVAGLRMVDAEIRDGYHPATHAGAQSVAARRLAADIDEFRTRHGLSRVVVVNVSSTEPPIPHLPEHDDLAALERALDDPTRTVLPPSSLMAYAALLADCSFVDFTPSPGIRLPALHAMAVARGVPYAGSDGKTGETLLRTVLAPMFTARALRVRSWSGTNLLGGGDGANLADPTQAQGKLDSKARGLAALLGEGVTAPLHIDNVPDLGEQKTAWDHVSFEGFLGARMSLQLTWMGLDSALAAPLVLDLARLTAAAHDAGESGPLGALAFFFKDPVGSDEHRFAEQTRMLTEWANNLRVDPTPTRILPAVQPPGPGTQPAEKAGDRAAEAPLPPTEPGLPLAGPAEDASARLADAPLPATEPGLPGEVGGRIAGGSPAGPTQQLAPPPYEPPSAIEPGLPGEAGNRIASGQGELRQQRAPLPATEPGLPLAGEGSDRIAGGPPAGPTQQLAPPPYVPPSATEPGEAGGRIAGGPVEEPRQQRSPLPATEPGLPGEASGRTAGSPPAEPTQQLAPPPYVPLSETEPGLPLPPAEDRELSANPPPYEPAEGVDAPPPYESPQVKAPAETYPQPANDPQPRSSTRLLPDPLGTLESGPPPGEGGGIPTYRP